MFSKIVNWWAGKAFVRQETTGGKWKLAGRRKETKEINSFPIIDDFDGNFRVK